MTGSAGQKRVPKAFFDRFAIPLPPLSQQKRIADILDKADAIRRKRQRAVTIFDELLKSYFVPDVW
ncbi:MAG: restriction endonuclease subunit S [Pirellulaceae bacterium]